jgi:hypothetical protein
VRFFSRSASTVAELLRPVSRTTAILSVAVIGGLRDRPGGLRLSVNDALQRDTHDSMAGKGS